MTSTDDGRILYPTPTHLPAPTRRVFDCETTAQSEEDEDQQLDAASTESPVSKHSCTTPTALNVDALPISDDPKSTTRVLSGYEEHPHMITDSSHEEDTLESAAVPRKDSQYSTLTSTTDASSVPDDHPTTGKAAKGTLPIEESDDDFGDFEEAEPTLDPPSAIEDDDFGDFQETAPGPEITSASGSQQRSSLLKLRGLDYVSHSKSLFQTMASATPLQRGGWVGVQDVKLCACSESRLGLQLLYPRALPAGFLRSSGSPVILSSQILTTEHRLLTRLGLHELYSRAQQQEAIAHSVLPRALESPPSGEGTQLDSHASVEDLSFDLDFLVQFSNHQPSASGASSKSGKESFLGEELARSSTLHELFDGILDSSQSSFVSHSSSPLNSRNEISLPLPPPAENPVVPQTSNLEEDDWDTFIDAEPVGVESTTQQESQQLNEDWSEFAEAEKLETETEVQKAEESDIFSGEWLNQLRSSHEPQSLAPQAVKASAQSSADDEWGTFTEAPNRFSSLHAEAQMPVAAEIEQLVQSHAPCLAAPQPSTAAKSTQWDKDLGALNAFSVVMPPVTRMRHQDEMLAMNAVLPTQSIQEASFGLEDDEWGGFQG